MQPMRDSLLSIKSLLYGDLKDWKICNCQGGKSERKRRECDTDVSIMTVHG